MSDSYKLRRTYGVIALILGIIASFGAGCFLVLSILIKETFALLFGMCLVACAILFASSSLNFIESGQYLQNNEDDEQDEDDEN